MNIKRSASWHRPLCYEGKEIGRIHLHDRKSILHTIQQGWIEHTEIDRSSPFDFKRDVVAIDIPSVRIARKIDLAKKDSFIAKYADNDKTYYEEGYALYIYTPDYQIEKHVTYTLDNNKDTIDYDILSFSLDCMIAMPTLQDKKLVYTLTHLTKIRTIKITSHGKTEYGEKLANITKEINQKLNLSDRYELSELSIEKLLNHYTLTPKA